MLKRLRESSVVAAKLDQERLHSLVNSMADGVLAVDEMARIVLYNGAALNILDVNIKLDGKPLESVMHTVDKNKDRVNIGKIVRATARPTTNRDMLLVYPDKSMINLYISIAPVHLGYGKEGERGFVVLLRDITHEKSLEEERDEFISVVSHELRTPIAIAEGNLSNAQLIIKKANIDGKIAETLEQAHEQILFLADIINDLSTLSRAERGKLQVEPEPINVHDLVLDLQKNYSPDANKKKLELLVRISPSLEVLNSSFLYVREILQNFITNAIKYTEKGSVTIMAEPKDDGVLFEVIDTGIGIGKADQARIFTKFYRADNSQTRLQTGTGLGLYVTMKLTKLIHAKIDVESEFGKGSTFRLFVPNLEIARAKLKA